MTNLSQDVRISKDKTPAHMNTSLNSTPDNNTSIYSKNDLTSMTRKYVELEDGST